MLTIEFSTGKSDTLFLTPAVAIARDSEITAVLFVVLRKTLIIMVSKSKK